MNQAYKNNWQRKQRQEFQLQNGFSTASHYGTGGLRRKVLERDNFRCVQCGMTDQEHKGTWGRPITIDHKDKNRKNNEMSNLQTLCLSCHGRKDIKPQLIVQKVPKFKSEILAARGNGLSYQTIADYFGFSIAAIWKWCRRWQLEI